MNAEWVAKVWAISDTTFSEKGVDLAVRLEYTSFVTRGVWEPSCLPQRLFDREIRMSS